MRLSLSLSFCIGTIVVFGIFFLMSLVWRYKASKVVSVFNLFVLFWAAFFMVIVSHLGSFVDFLLGLAILVPALYFSREGMLRLQFINDNKLLYRHWWHGALVIDQRLNVVHSFFVAILFIALSGICGFFLRLLGILPSSAIMVSWLPSLGALLCMIIFFLLLKNKKLKKLVRLV